MYSWTSPLEHCQRQRGPSFVGAAATSTGPNVRVANFATVCGHHSSANLGLLVSLLHPFKDSSSSTLQGLLERLHICGAAHRRLASYLTELGSTNASHATRTKHVWCSGIRIARSAKKKRWYPPSQCRLTPRGLCIAWRYIHLKPLFEPCVAPFFPLRSIICSLISLMCYTNSSITCILCEADQGLLGRQVDGGRLR